MKWPGIFSIGIFAATGAFYATEKYAEHRIATEIQHLSTRLPEGSILNHAEVDAEVLYGRFSISDIEYIDNLREVKISRINGQNLTFDGSLQLETIGELSLLDVQSIVEPCCEIGIGELKYGEVSIRELEKKIRSMEPISHILQAIKEPIVATNIDAKTKFFTATAERAELSQKLENSDGKALNVAVEDAKLIKGGNSLPGSNFLPDKLSGNFDFSILSKPSTSHATFQFRAEITDQANLQVGFQASGPPGTGSIDRNSAGLASVVVHSALLNYNDFGLVSGMMEQSAGQFDGSRTSAAKAIRSRLQTILRADGLRAQKAYSEIERFLINPESLEIRIDPREPIALPVMFALGVIAPDRLADVLQVEIFANRAFQDESN